MLYANRFVMLSVSYIVTIPLSENKKRKKLRNVLVAWGEHTYIPVCLWH